MNLDIFNFATQGVAVIGTALVKEDTEGLRKYEADLVALSDDELKVRCRQANRGEDAESPPRSGGLVSTLTDRLSWFERRASSLTLQRLAVAIEAFRRAPADLPPESTLYPQQIQAAISLTRRCLIQMDTGEGKTYALLPAAFALACEYHRVYVVCANEYLAWRDAHRTRAFWEFVGLGHGLCLGKRGDDWSSRVIYTTISSLIFEHMANLAETQEPAAPITFGAILLDEADAVLLDDGDQTFSLIQEIKGEAFDWSFALQFAESLIQDEEIESEYGTLEASLTIAGETKLRETLSRLAPQDSNYLLNRLAVELAYVALRVATQDRDYVIERDHIYAVDPISGKVLYNRRPNWVTPLEFQRGFTSRPERIDIDNISTIAFLQRFLHLSGLSGTIADDALEYLFLYVLPTLIIKPRRKKHKGIEPDLVYRTNAEALEALCNEVLDACNANRSVLVGTQNIADAEKAYLMLSRILPAGTSLKLLTGKNDYDAAQVFEQGGEVGSVIVATQLAGRGVDIRLSEAVRQNGGLVLLGLGRSLTSRHDKQFLGRAGRQGDPFNARFICSFQDELLRTFIGQKVDKLMEVLGQEHGVAIESSMVTQRITAVQNNYRKRIFWSNQQQAFLDSNSAVIRKALSTWFEYLQLPDTDSSAGHYSLEFLDWAVDFYLENVLAEVVPKRGTIPQAEAEQIADFINASLGLAKHQRGFSSNDIEARDFESLNQTLKQMLLKKLKDEMSKYLAERKAAYQRTMGRAGEPIESGSEQHDEIGPVPTPEAYLHFNQITEREPRLIALWSIRSEWMAFIQERQRIIHRARQRRLSYLEYYRVVTDQITHEWQKTEKQISSAVLHNLLRSSQPSALNDLFVYQDSRAASPDNSENENPYTWDVQVNKNIEDCDPRENVRFLVGQFVAQAAGHLTASFDSSRLRRLLIDFTEKNSLYMLQGPSQIQKALDAWSILESERSVGTALRKVHKKWLGEFLLFLRERKLVGALPTFQTRVRSALARFIKTSTETRTALTYLGIIVFVSLLSLTTYWGTFAQPKHLGPFGTTIDLIVFGGLLARGSITAPAFGVLILTSLILVFIFPHAADAPRDTVSLEKALALLLQVAFGLWITDWHYGQMTIMSSLQSLGIFLSIFAVALITKRVTSLLANTFGLSLIDGWLSYSLLFVLLPATAQGARKWIVILVFAAIALANYFWQQVNGQEIELVSALVKHTTGMQAEEISGNLQVKADCGPSPHVYAVLSAWLLYELLAQGPLVLHVSSLSHRLLIFTGVYLMVMAGRILYIMNRRFSIDMWQADLNERHQMMKGVFNSSELSQKLKQIKRQLLVRELGFQILIIVVAVFLLRDSFLPGTMFPLSLVIVFGAFLFGSSSRRFILQLQKLLHSRASVDLEVLDFSRVPETNAERSTWHTVKRLAKWGFTVGMAIYGIFEVVTAMYDVLSRLKIVR